MASSLLEKIRLLTKDSIVYAFGRTAEFVTSFFLVPIFTRIFSPKDYGVLDTITTFSSVAIIMLSLGFSSAVQRYYYQHNDAAERKRIFSTAWWILIIASLFFSSVVFLAASFVSSIILSSSEYFRIIQVVAFTLPITLLVSYLKDFIRLQRTPWKFNALSLTDIILRFGTIILLVVVLRFGIIGNFLGVLFSSIGTFTLALIISRRHFTFSISRQWIRPLFSYGTPLVAAGLAYWIMNLSDRLFLAHLVPLSDLGLYSIANRISSIMMLLVTAFQLAWSPLIFSMINEANIKQFIGKTMTYAFVVFSFASISLTLLAPKIFPLLAPATYFDSIPYVAWLSTGLTVLAISSIAATGLTLANRTKFITLGSFIGAAVNILGNIWLIPKLGALGASITTLTAYVALFIIFLYYSQKFYQVPFEYVKLIKITSLCGLYILLANYWLSPEQGGWLLRIGLIGLYPILIYISGTIGKEEFRSLTVIFKGHRGNEINRSTVK